MANENIKNYYKDISDDLLYVSQLITKKIASNNFDLSDEKIFIKEILENLESQLSR